MNKLKAAERYIKRRRLAELIGTNATYLSVLADKVLSEEMERRVEDAVRYVIKELKKGT